MKWLLIRGLGREQRHWESFPEIFSKQLPGSEIHFLDLPGIGTQHQKKSPLSIEAITDDLRSRWGGVRGKSKDWNILAISLGGMIALDWLHRHPGDFNRAVILNTSSADKAPFYHRLRMGIWHNFAGIIMAGDLIEREKRIIEMTANLVKGEQVQKLSKKWAGYSKEFPVSKTVLLSQLKAAASFKLPEKIQKPVLFLTSDADRMVHSDCTKKIAGHFGAKFIAHNHAGHDLSLDAPEWVAGRVEQWLKGAER